MIMFWKEREAASGKQGPPFMFQTRVAHSLPIL